MINWKDLKISYKITLGFAIVVFILIVVGTISLFSSMQISKDYGNVIYEKNPLKEAAMHTSIELYHMQTKILEYQLSNENLAALEEGITLSTNTVDMYIQMLNYGTESNYFKQSEAGKFYLSTNNEIIFQEPNPETQKLAKETKIEIDDIKKELTELYAIQDSIQKYNIYKDGDYIDIEQWVLQKEIDHLRWVEDLENTILQHNKFTGQIDPTKCSFGQWYYSYDVEDQKLMALLKKIESPHEQLHRLGEKINAESNSAIKQEIYTNEVVPTLEEIKLVFKELNSYLTPLLADYKTQKSQISDNINQQIETIEEQITEIDRLADEEAMTEVSLAEKTEKISNTLIIVSIIFGTILAIFIALIITRSIVKPINKIRDEAKEIANTGDLTKRATVTSSDEVGEMALALNDMLDNTAGPVKALSEIAETISKGDLRVNVDVQAKGDIVKLVTAMKMMVDSLKEFVGLVAKNANSSATSAEELSASAQEVNASTEQVSSTIQEIAKGGQHLSQISSKTKGVVDQQNKVTEIGKASGKKAGEVM